MSDVEAAAAATGHGEPAGDAVDIDTDEQKHGVIFPGDPVPEVAEPPAWQHEDDAGVAAEEEVPGFVTEGTADEDIEIDTEDASESGYTDVMETSRGVIGTIKKASIDTYTPKEADQWQTHRLKLELAIGPDGVDKKGKYKNKRVFPRFAIAVNRDAYPDAFKSAFWGKGGGAWDDWGDFQRAVGIDPKAKTKVTRPFLRSLVDQQVKFDIIKQQQSRKVNGKYEKLEGEYENIVRHFQKAPAPVAAVEEAAAVTDE